MRFKTLLGLAFVGAFGYFVVSSFGNQVSGYETFTEATASGRSAHVAGTWVRAQPAAYDPSTNRFEFRMADEDGVVRTVVYANPKPANFEDAERVVVQGRMEGDRFAAEHILVKCPSKYNGERSFEGSVPGETPGAPAEAPRTGPPTVPASAPLR